jgi:AAA+ superfamily predicted ATPase
MDMDKLTVELVNVIKAHTNVIQIISYETLRIHAMLAGAARELKRDLFSWSRVEGIKKWDADKRIFVEADTEVRGAERILEFFRETEQPCILLLEDFHPDLDERQPETIKRLRNIALSQNYSKNLVLSQPFRKLPSELEKEVHIMELPYPAYEDIVSIYDQVCENYKIPDTGEPDKDLIDSALGLTIMEAAKAFSLAYIENGKLTSEEVPLIIKEKENIIRKSGFLEYYDLKESMDDVGGLDNLKDWLKKRSRAFVPGAADFGLTYPRGILLLGLPGTGKSLTAKAVGSLLRFPLLRLDMGKVFQGYVGESEKNIRGSLKIAEAIAPSILWIDEIEKGMSGLSSSGSSDGGTTARVLGTFLTWMQEKTTPVFVVATANDISQLPPEMLRKGRVDEIFFVDLPSQKEREQILSIHLKKKRRAPKNFNVRLLAEKSKGFTGAELAEVINESLFQAYNDDHEIRDEDIIDAINKTFPQSRANRELIEQLRQWSKTRAVAASSEQPEKFGDEKDISPKLPQEAYSNPFIKKA